MRHVQKAAEGMFNAAHSQFMRACCRIEMLVFAALLLHTRLTGGHHDPRAPFPAPQEGGLPYFERWVKDGECCRSCSCCH